MAGTRSLSAEIRKAVSNRLLNPSHRRLAAILTSVLFSSLLNIGIAATTIIILPAFFTGDWMSFIYTFDCFYNIKCFHSLQIDGLSLGFAWISGYSRSEIFDAG